MPVNDLPPGQTPEEGYAYQYDLLLMAFCRVRLPETYVGRPMEWWVEERKEWELVPDEEREWERRHLQAVAAIEQKNRHLKQALDMKLFQFTLKVERLEIDPGADEQGLREILDGLREEAAALTLEVVSAPD